jgi:N-acetylglucosamine kinase-like BadF-type ATPase
MRCVLAIDSGGTKCHVILAGDDGRLLGWAKTVPKGESFLLDPGGRGRNQQVVLGSITQAIGDREYDELHISSVGNIPLGFLGSKPSWLQVHLVNEPIAAFRLAGVTCGVCALAGTGAFVHGRTPDGRTRHLDGLGPLLGDHGSGYTIGLRAIQATARAEWHPRRHTSLVPDVLSACHIRGEDVGRESLVTYMSRPRDRSEIAGVARFVSAAAARGDAVATQILRDAAADLASTVYDVVDQLSMKDDDYPFVGTGGVITGSDLYWEHLCVEVARFAPRLRPLRSDLPAVVGVALAALARMSKVDYEAAKGRLIGDVTARLAADGSAMEAADRQGG